MKMCFEVSLGQTMLNKLGSAERERERERETGNGTLMKDKENPK